MAANKFVLKHGEIEIDYTIGMPPVELPVGITPVALTYTDGPNVKEFSSNEITTNETALGSLVSVPLVMTVDTGGEKFAFFLPQLQVSMGKTEEFITVGIHEKFSGPDSLNPPSWRSIELHGTAQTVWL